MNSDTALLLIDVQLNMFDPQRPVFDALAYLDRFKKLLALSRASGTRLVFIQNNGPVGAPDEPRAEGWLLHPELEIGLGDLIIQKNQADSFEETALFEKLKQMGVTKLIIAGLQSESCIITNCKKAAALGFKVTLVADAHSTYDSAGKTAPEIIEAVNREAKGVAQLWRVDDVNI